MLLPSIENDPIPVQKGTYTRYQIHNQDAPDTEKWPSRFKVKVGKLGLAKLLFKEIWHYRGRKDVILSRPCMYGVFSGPVGGFAPREELCVGCLRCTTEFPDFVRIEHNPERRKLGDSYFTFNYVDAINAEAASGQVPVKGAGYRGEFGGEGWDGMWTDMSEIVRPTRDGIHGREFISTVVDIGYQPNFLLFDQEGQPYGPLPRSFPISLPMLFDSPPASLLTAHLGKILSRAANDIETLTVLPLEMVLQMKDYQDAIIPLVSPYEIEKLTELAFSPRMFEMESWDQALFNKLQESFPESLIALRAEIEDDHLLDYADSGVQVLHLTANYHGRSKDGRFILDLIREAHAKFVDAGIRGEVTLIGSGGMIAAEHLPKAILCGLDAVALDTALLTALQADFEGECLDRESSQFHLPSPLNEDWAVQRLKNLMSAWRDQLLEILGAMGLREVRRLRGEMGRAMFMKTLEAEAFADLEGYDG